MDKFIELEELAFGSRMKRMSEILMRDVRKVYKSLYIDFDPYLFPVFKTIIDETEISIGEISNCLQISQPAVTQFINTLHNKKLVNVSPHKIDRRKKMVSLSDEGQILLVKMTPIWKIMQQEVALFIDREPTSFINHIRLTEKEQSQDSLYNRIMRRIKENVEIVGFSKEYSSIFYELNIEWLEKYFYVEEYDKKILKNPKSCIVDNNGFIFFAKFNGEIVGTVALINEKECYELSKMAVSPKYQGLKIGQKLMNHCIQFSKEQGWEKIMLYSSTKLAPAINLYRKVGFQEVALEKDSNYERSNIKMILEL